MKINQYGSSGVNPYQRQLQTKNNQLDKQPTKKSEQVEISSQAKLLQQQATVEKTRSDKIQSLKIQLENGTYKPDASKIALSMKQFYQK